MQKLDSSTILLAFIAILFGLGGTYALRQYLRQAPPVVAETLAPKPPQKITVPLASRNIATGTRITMDDVALYKMTREEIKKSVKVHTFMTNPDQILGKLVMTPIKKGRPFNTEDFYPPGTIPGIGKRIPTGTRALTIMMEPTGALIGFAGPGQHVDVLFHYGQIGSLAGGASLGGSGSGGGAGAPNAGFVPPHHLFNPPRNRDYFGNTIGGGGGGIGGGFGGGSGLQNATVTLVQDVEIMALGRESTPTDAARQLASDEKVPVTLAVSPRQAELIRVAAGHGVLSLTLRAPADEAHVVLRDPVTIDEIINVSKESNQMVIHRGTSVSRLNFAGSISVESKLSTAQVNNNTNSDKANPSNAQQPPLRAVNTASPYPYWPYPPQQFVPGLPPGYYPQQNINPQQQQPVNQGSSSNGSQSRAERGRTP